MRCNGMDQVYEPCIPYRPKIYRQQIMRRLNIVVRIRDKIGKGVAKFKNVKGNNRSKNGYPKKPPVCRIRKNKRKKRLTTRERIPATKNTGAGDGCGRG